MKKISLCFGLILMFTFAVMAQNVYKDKADRYYTSRNFYDAIDHYKKAYSKEKNKAVKAEILFFIGECYRNVSDTKNAEAWYAKAIKVKYKNPIVYLYYAEALKANGNYADAVVQYNAFKQEMPSDPRGAEGVKSAEMAQKWKDKPSRYKVENFSVANSKAADFAPSYSAKGSHSIIYTSANEQATGKEYDASWSGEKNTDLFEIASDKKGKWSSPVNIPAPVSTDAKEGTSSFERHYTDMYFTRCEQGKGRVVLCKLYLSKRTGPAVWTEPEMLPFCADSSTYGQPSLSADGNTLYFVSDREGGMGGRDLWKVEMGKDKVWGTPVNLGAPINTPEDELFPFIHADGTLYFSSNSHQGEGNMGGLDIFSAKFKDGKWGNITNMKAPINSPADDYGIIWEDTELRGYFSSNRDGGKGKDDIYSFMLPPLIFTLQGTVKDADTKKPLADAKVDMVNTTDGSSLSFTTDGSGTYKFSLSVNSSYKLNANKKDYLGAKAEENTIGLEVSKDFYRDFLLKTFSKPIVLPNIVYDLDQATLRPESRTALDGLVETLKENPTLVIELGAHTDTRGDDLHNERLSQARAQSVVDYLVSKGIEVGRLVPRGYGEKKSRVLQNDEKVVYNSKEFSFPKDAVMTDDYINKLKTKDEQEAAHQLNRRTEFLVLRNDYVPGQAPPPPATGGGGTPEYDKAKADSLTRALTTHQVDTVTSGSVIPDAPPVIKEEPKAVEEKKPLEAKDKFYTAVKGDTYASIAAANGLSEDELRAINGFATGKKPKEGTKLRIVDENEYHTVVKGDNYGKVAKQYNLKMSDLKKMNNIEDQPITNYKKLIVKDNNSAK